MSIELCVECGKEWPKGTLLPKNDVCTCELLNKILYYTAHEDECIRNTCHAGEPRPDGSYWNLYGKTWYQSSPIDNTPKCDCGLDDLLERVSYGKN